MDEVEGIGQLNAEDWSVVFSGAALTYTVTSGLTPTLSYRFKVKAISEYNKESQFSSISTFIAASLPEQIAFPADPFIESTQSSITITWD